MGKAVLYSLKREGRGSHGCPCADVAHPKQQLCLHLVAVWLPCGHWKQGPAKRRLPQSRLAVPSNDARSTHGGTPALGSHASKGVICQNRMPSFKAHSRGSLGMRATSFCLRLPRFSGPRGQFCGVCCL